MLHFELIENTDTSVTYRYFPENQQNFGMITVRKNDKVITHQILATGDEYKWYFSHMYKRIKQYIEAKEYKEKGIIAWY